MSLIEDIEEKSGLKIESLNAVEKQTFLSMISEIEKVKMTPEKLKDYITSMREAVENDLAKEPSFIRILIFKVENPNLIRLQARLQNYLLLESFLLTPERAKAQLDGMLNNVLPKK
jgi:hypothetical protein